MCVGVNIFRKFSRVDYAEIRAETNWEKAPEKPRVCFWKTPSLFCYTLDRRPIGECTVMKKKKTNPQEAYRKALHSTHYFLEQISAALKVQQLWVRSVLNGHTRQHLFASLDNRIFFGSSIVCFLLSLSFCVNTKLQQVSWVKRHSNRVPYTNCFAPSCKIAPTVQWKTKAGSAPLYSQPDSW